MGDERFDIVSDTFPLAIFDNETGKFYDENKLVSIVDLLNELNNEIVNLRSLHIDIMETIIKEPFYVKISKEFLEEELGVTWDEIVKIKRK